LRVQVRRPTPEDEAEFLAMSRAGKRFHGRWWGLATDPDGYRKYLGRIDGVRYEGFLVCLRDGGGIVGVVNVNEIIRGRLQSGFLGYAGNVAHAGTGLMTDGVRLVLSHTFTKLKLHRLEANIQPANHRSIALAKRCGFRKEGFSPRYLKLGGQWRDHERWAMTVEGWRHTRQGTRKSTPKKRKSLN
jgi:[ribosomal protein S5]-alanine N-acetyltransferase